MCGPGQLCLSGVLLLRELQKQQILCWPLHTSWLKQIVNQEGESDNDIPESLWKILSCLGLTWKWRL